MPKDDKKVHNDRSKYINTQQTETYRQQLTKERHILADKTSKDIERLKPYFEVNNNYLALLKHDGQKNNSDAVPFEHPLEKLGQVENTYCQKCPRDRKFCPHKNQARLEERIEELKYPMTSTQNYGWRKPIDDTVGKTGYGIKTAFQVFPNDFRQTDKKKEVQ